MTVTVKFNATADHTVHAMHAMAYKTGSLECHRATTLNCSKNDYIELHDFALCFRRTTSGKTFIEQVTKLLIVKYKTQ